MTVITQLLIIALVTAHTVIPGTRTVSYGICAQAGIEANARTIVGVETDSEAHCAALTT